jgi:tetratricopeptide (TPR) repeat protein
MEGRELGKALQKFHEALKVQPLFPEAEMAIGDIYREEGEEDLASRQYEKTEKLKNRFNIPASLYQLYYKMALNYQDQQLYYLMEETLKSIIRDDSNFNQPSISTLQQQIASNFKSKGIDFILTLYRFDGYFAADAHSQLGWFYYKTGRQDLAMLHFLYSIIYKLGKTIDYATERDPDFKLTTLSAFFSYSSAKPQIGAFLNICGIYKDLYYLAGAIYQTYPLQAASLWKLVAGQSGSGRYQQLSRDQLASPWYEPVLRLPERPGTP